MSDYHAENAQTVLAITFKLSSDNSVIYPRRQAEDLNCRQRQKGLTLDTLLHLLLLHTLNAAKNMQVGCSPSSLINLQGHLENRKIGSA